MNALKKLTESEKSVLSALVTEPSLISHKGICDLTESDFRSEEAQEIFKLVRDEKFDFVALLEKTSGDVRAMALELSGNFYSKANLHVYAELVKESSEIRKTHKTLSEAQQALVGGGSVDQVKNEVIASLTATGEASERSLGSICHSLVEQMEKRLESGGFSGLATGYEKLDEIWLGMDEGDLIILGARPAMGKTSLMLNIGTHTVKQNKNVFVFSLEMPAEQLINRLISDEANLCNKLLKRPTDMDDLDWSKYSKAMGKIKDQSWHIFDNAMTLDKLLSTIRRKSIEVKPDLIMIDYLQLISAKAESRVMEITKISGQLKAIAKEMKCPVIALSQLSRKVEERSDKRPSMADLRDSGSIEQDADKIAFIYRDDVYNEDTPAKGLAEIITTKNRAGENGTVTLEADFRHYRFKSTDRVAERYTPPPQKRGFHRPGMG